MLRGNNFQLVYASKAIKQHDEKSLSKMLCEFKENNRYLDVTGLLLYDDLGIFVQLIEGEQDVVKSLYQRIEKDQRHSLITLLHEQFTDERIFPDWRMGFQFFGESHLSELEMDTALSSDEISVEFFNNNKVLFLDLLWCFKQT